MLPIALLIVAILILFIPVLFGADQTILANKFMEQVILEGEKDIVDRYVEIFTTNGNDFVGGFAVTTEAETAPDIDLAASGEQFSGVLLGYAFPHEAKASYSLGVTLPDGKKVRVLRKTGGRVTCQMLMDHTTTTAKTATVVAKGAPIFISQTIAGAITTTSPGTGALILKTHVGYLRDALAAFTANKVVRVLV